MTRVNAFAFKNSLPALLTHAWHDTEQEPAKHFKHIVTLNDTQSPDRGDEQLTSFTASSAGLDSFIITISIETGFHYAVQVLLK